MYVDFTSFDSNGGFPTNKVYIMTPVDHTSTSKLWPYFPCSISGAEREREKERRGRCETEKKKGGVKERERE